MKKAGGIIALIAGIFAVLAAIFTLLAGGFVSGLEGASASLEGTAKDTEASDAIFLFALGGVLFSFLTIVLGAVCMGAKGRLPGILLILCAIAGAVLGGTFVAVFMVLALIGGVLALFGNEKKEASA